MLELASGTPLPLVGAFLLGLIVGSFLNVVIHRLPIMLNREWRSQCRELLHQEARDTEAERFDLTWPPSQCPNCNTRIRSFENVPVFSWLLLRGRCRTCRAPISARYPLVEILTGVLFLLVVGMFGLGPQGISGLLFVSLLIAAAFIDLDHQLLPDCLSYPLLWSGLLISIWSVHVSPSASILGAVVGYLSLWSVFHAFRLLTGKEGMGYGDFKLLAAIGAWTGWQLLLPVILLSSASGIFVAVVASVLGRFNRDQPMPFGPYLAIGGLVVFLFGDQLAFLVLPYVAFG